MTVMLTELLRYHVRERDGRALPVKDLAIALMDSDYPPVTAIRFESDRTLKTIGWEAVKFEPARREFVIQEPTKISDARDDDPEVLLRRDILDSLILDLLGRRTTRVCDLMFEEEDGTLRLKGADAGMAAMIRRVLRGRWFKADRSDMFDWKYVEFLRGDPNAVTNGAGYRLRINRLPPGEIARLTDYVPYLHAAELLKLLPDEKAASVLQATSLDRQVQIIDELSDKEAIDLLCLMSPDLATDLIGRLDVASMRRFLEAMPEKNRKQIVDLLRYPEDSVGGSMINDILTLTAQMTCKEGKQAVQDKMDEVRFTTLVFVVDNAEDKRLRGALALRDLMATDDKRTVGDVMDPYLQPLGPFDDANDAAYRIVSGQLSAMPVINKDGALIGAMTVEAALGRLVPTNSNLQRLRVFS